VFGAWLNNGLVSGKFPRAYSISDGSGSNLITRLADVQFSQSNMRVIVSSATQADINAGAPANNTVYKFADAYKPNAFAACVNAGTVGTDTSGFVPVVDRLILGADGDNSSNRMTGTISRITYYPQRLSNAELVEITA
jgi:hypothetical protein